MLLIFFLFFFNQTFCYGRSNEDKNVFLKCMKNSLNITGKYEEALIKTGSNNLYSMKNLLFVDDIQPILFAATIFEIKRFNSATLWYIGGHRECHVGQQTIINSPNAFNKLIIFEPTPVFFKELEINLAHFNKVSVILNNYGLSNKNYSIWSELRGAATSSRNSFTADVVKKYQNYQELRIRDFYSALKENTFNKTAQNMLYMNCEGCEIEVMEALLDNKLAHYFSIIHIATHFLRNENNKYIMAYCKISEKLVKTHKKVYGFMFAQDRWIIRSKNI